jgi:hypothetical protein
LINFTWRVSQNNGLVRQWARRGTRPRQPADQRYDNAPAPAGRPALRQPYLFGAICPARSVGAALALPHANTEAMQLHLDEISRTVAAGVHAVLIFDRAGWHTTPNLLVPENITPIWLPSRAPELNRSRTSGNTYAPTGSPTASSKPSTTSRAYLPRIEQTHRPARNHRLHREARLGSRRSEQITFGMTRSFGIVPNHCGRGSMRTSSPS